MNRVQLLKLAYARGAYLALQEAGYQEKVAEDLAIKIADRDALDVLEDVGIGAGVGGLGGAALGAGAGALAGRFGRMRMNPNIAGDAMSEKMNLLKMLGPDALEQYAAGTQRTIPWAKVPGAVPTAPPPTTMDQNLIQRQLARLYGSPVGGSMAAGGAAGFGAGTGLGGVVGGLAGE